MKEIIGFIMVLSCLSGAAQANIILNGEFDDGTGWPDYSQWSWPAGQAGITTADHTPASPSAYVAPGGNYAIIQTTSPTIAAGDAYVVSYQTELSLNEGYGGATRVALAYNNGGILTEIPGASQSITLPTTEKNWQTHNFSFMAQPGKDYIGKQLGLMLVNSGSSGWVGFDSVAINEGWKVGKPITTYYCPDSPPLTGANAEQMAKGGFNLVAAHTLADLDTAQAHGLRAMWMGSLYYDTIMSVRNHPALYSYYVADEPFPSRFEDLASIVTTLRERDPKHAAYINLWASSTEADTTDYPIHLNSYMNTVHPSLLSYDGYSFKSNGVDVSSYFRNLSIISTTAKQASIPFMQVVQACTWTPEYRAPSRNELRFLYNTSLAYGAAGVETWLYSLPGSSAIVGGMANADGTTTTQYDAVQTINPQFVTVAERLQPLAHIGAYHLGDLPWGFNDPNLSPKRLPGTSPFTISPTIPETDFIVDQPIRGALLGLWGPNDQLANATRAFLVNLDYSNSLSTTIYGPSNDMASFNAATKTWTLTGANNIPVTLDPGAGIMVGVGKITAQDGDTIDTAGHTGMNQTVEINGMGAGGNGALRNSSANAGGGIDLSVVLASNSAIGVTGAGELIVGDVGGNYSLTKVGSGRGTLTLAGTSTYTGGTVVNAGNLRFRTASALPSTGIVQINSGGAVLVSGAYSTVTNWLNSGKIDTASTGALALTAASSEAINMGSYNNLSLGATGNYTYSGTMTPANNTYRFGGGGGTLTVSSALSGERSLVVSGNVTLSGTKSYTGGTTVNSGNLKFSTTSAIPTLGTILINSGGAVLVSGAYTTAQSWLNSGKISTASTGALAFTANSSGAVNMGSYTNLSIGANGNYTYSGTMTPANNTYRFGGGGGTLAVASALSGGRSLVTSGNVTLTGANTYSGTTTINAGTLQVGAGGNSGALGAGNVVNNAALAFNRSDAYTVSNLISGPGRLIKSGDGAITLSNSNTYTGATTVSAGTLVLGGASGSINSTSGITLNGGTLLHASSTPLDRPIDFVSGTFGGIGTHIGNLSPQTGHLAPGNVAGVAVGTLTITGGLDLDPRSVLDFDFGTTAGSCDRIAFSGSNGHLILNGTINITCTSSLPAGQYTIFSGATSITDDGLVFGSVPAGHTYSYAINGGSVIVTAAPEPGTVTMLACGILSAAAYMWQKRQKRQSSFGV